MACHLYHMVYCRPIPNSHDPETNKTEALNKICTNMYSPATRTGLGEHGSYVIKYLLEEPFICKIIETQIVN
jgi:hypothetical protein